MPEKAVTFGVALVMTVGIVAALTELFVPLAAKVEMNACCRSILIRMEVEGGLTPENRDGLVQRLQEKGFTNVSVTGTARAAWGETISLSVSANYEYSKIAGLFHRKAKKQTMHYERISAARRVVN